MAALNYAKEYSRALAQAFPYVLNFGALYSTPNNNRYRWVNAKTNDNAWETKTLTNERKWSTLVHPMDIDQTNMVATISNITQVFNEEQKFPEMDAYTISKIYADWITVDDPLASVAGTKRAADTTALTVSNVLQVFDNLMLKMDNERVPANGRILYVTHEVKKLLNNADKVSRSINVESGPNAIDRRVNRLDEVQVIGVPATLMKTLYDFTAGWEIENTAKQINMFLVHPLAVITPVSYTFSRLDAPSALSEGKYTYYEESFEDVFILNKKSGAIQFNMEA